MFGLHVLMVTFKFPSFSWKTPFCLIVSNTFIFPFYFAFLIIFYEILPEVISWICDFIAEKESQCCLNQKAQEKR